MLIRADLPPRPMRALIRLARLHDCEVAHFDKGLLFVEGDRALIFLADALRDERVSVVAPVEVDG
jgi:hypothetical protein